MKPRLVLAVLLPFLALGLQWVAWAWIRPFVWFLFFPAVFFSARFSGFWGGVLSTILSTVIVIFFFIPPQLSWKIDNPANLYSVGLFLVMGGLFSDSQGRLRQAREKIARALNESERANEKIAELYHKSLELDELKTQFFANVSHELRTPLTLIMSPLARRVNGSDLPEEIRREDVMMLRNARLLHRHVSDLLDIAKLESGQMSGQYARLDIGGLVRALVSQFDSLAKDRKIDYRYDGVSALQIEADGEKVQRILLNLLSNAFKFTPENGRITVRLRQASDMAVIEVQDDGPGVPADQRERIFERFCQVDGGAQRRFGGTGLGLTIVKEFTELHGGDVRVLEAPGGGALFVVQLPLQAPPGVTVSDGAVRFDLDRQIVEELQPAAREVASRDPAGFSADTPLVLVVEDNVDMNAFVADSLRQYYRVACAFDGREGLERALALHPDLILSDVMMPNMSGDQMVRELRRQKILADIPVLMLTAKTDDTLRVSMFESGVQGYISKPFVVEEMLARVGGLIKGRKQVEAELRSSELTYRSLFENMMNGYAHCLMLFEDGKPRDFIYLDVNEAFETQTGLKDVVGRRASDVIPGIREADPGLLESYGRVAMGGAPERFETYVETLGMWFSISVYSPRHDHFVALFDVITERKTAEEQLMVSEERLQLALDATGDGLWDWNLRRGTAFLTQHCREMTGYDLAGDETPGFDFFTRTVHPDDLSQVLANLDAHLQGKIPTSEFDYRLPTPSGEIKWMRGRGRVVERDASGAALRMVGTITDISIAKAAEDALRCQTEELAERNAELERFNRATVGRELDMIALKQQINDLSRQLGREPPYPLPCVNSQISGTPS
ncbi:ATP-binding protein [Telmatospirillum sp.]|uniref:ATP-binding protein n=1 Tax=Telmatospirillum sp. TaxID=2079197 RepID=UPI0028505766|nr:ATP-binding protein [Telmatospirillum sp.]MDR3435689.1 ATP-binding protein [Telmatospirillum sp.]